MNIYLINNILFNKPLSQNNKQISQVTTNIYSDLNTILTLDRDSLLRPLQTHHIFHFSLNDYQCTFLMHQPSLCNSNFSILKGPPSQEEGYPTRTSMARLRFNLSEVKIRDSWNWGLCVYWICGCIVVWVLILVLCILLF